MPKKNKSKFRYTLLAIALLMALSVIPMWIAPSMAKGRVTFKPPGTQAPKSSTGGASRDGSSCGVATTKANKNLFITPLIPKTNIGLTVAERPAIFVYVPETNAKKAFFSIQDEDTNTHYQTTISLPNTAGVMEVKLPDSTLALETGKNYKWSLVMICTADLEPDSPVISGWIRRTGNQQNSTASVESASNLAKIGICFNCFLARTVKFSRTRGYR
jgi:Domain of Unknown Function (DUF928)